jgi:tetratricopeptide (TPR) repeat protein
MQMQATRKELHALALDALEYLYGNAKNRYAELAHHAKYAGLGSKAQKYYVLAGKTAAESYQNYQAIEYYTRALAFVSPDNLAAQFDIVTERIELYSHMGKRDLQWRDLNSLERWAEELADTDRVAKSLMMRAAYYFAISDYLNSIDCSERAESLSSSITNGELALYTQVVWSLALLRLGRLAEAMQRAQTTLERARLAGNRKEESRVLTTMGLIALEQREPANAHIYLTEALEIARGLKDLSLEARALNNLALAEGYVNGNYALARQYFEDYYRIARETGDRVSESNALGNLGFAAGMQGDLVAARSYHEQALHVAREIGNRYQEMYTLINLSAVSGFQYEAMQAMEYAKEAVELSRKIAERVGEAWATLYMGHASLLNNDLHLAEMSYRKSFEIRKDLGQLALSMEPLAGLVETHLRANDLEAASQEAEHILEFLEGGSTLNGTEEPLRVYYACYQFLKKNQDLRSKAILQTAMTLLEAQVSKFSDENERRRYVENIPWRRAIWDAAQLSQS